MFKNGQRVVRTVGANDVPKGMHGTIIQSYIPRFSDRCSVKWDSGVYKSLAYQDHMAPAKATWEDA